MKTRIPNLIVRHALAIAIIGTGLAIAGAFFSVKLYSNLRTDIEELLPETARSVVDLNRLTERLASFDNLVVLVSSTDKGESKRFVDDLAKQLKAVPKNIITRVEYRINREIAFFKDRQALYLDLAELKELHVYIRDRISYEKKVRNPLGIFPVKDLKEPKFDFEKFGTNHRTGVELFTRYPGGYYSTQDERMRAMVVYMPGKGVRNAQRLKTALVDAVATLNPSSYGSDLKVQYTGNVENLIEESAALVADLQFSTAVVLILVTLAMALFYRSFWATGALVVSLIMGTLWTFGVSYFLVENLNANTAFLASIVIGNGINFGVIFLARYLEERRKETLASVAMETAMVRTAAATATAAAAAGVSYGSLMLTSFRGFSQFGIIGFVGMFLCWVSAYTLLPAYLILADRWVAPALARLRSEFSPMKSLARGIERYAGLICFLAIVAGLFSLLSLKNYNKTLIETDFSKLRDKESMTHGSGALYHYIDQIFGHSSSPLVILPDRRHQARKIANLIKAKRKKEGSSSVITTIQTLDDFIPTKQHQKIEKLKEIQAILNPQVLRFMSDRERELISEALGPSAFTPFTEKDLPPLILDRFREKDASLGKIVLVDKLVDTKSDDSNKLADFITTVRQSADGVAKNVPVAGELAVTYDMFQAILHDGPKVTLCAFFLVMILVSLLFRNLRTIGLALMALLLGVLWLMGIILGFHLKLNFLNFIALPITFGIGIDYGVNMFQRYREDGVQNMLDVIRNTGGAVMLCSLTTVIGYSSLLMAGNQAFVSFGLLAVLGEITCVLAAVVALPAYLSLRKSRRPTGEYALKPDVVSMAALLLLAVPLFFSSRVIGKAATVKELEPWHSIQEAVPGGRDGYYSRLLPRILKRWPPKDIPDITNNPNPIWMQAIRTKGDDDYIGLQKRVMLHAPMEKIEEMIEGFENYTKLFDGIKKVEVTKREGNRWTISWVRESPAFFIKNPRYDQAYVIDKTEPDRHVYRYQLKEGGTSLNYADGLIVLERKAKDVTCLTAWDFFHANWGIVRSLAGGTIWRRNLEGSYLGDAAFKMKAEHPDWTYDKVRNEAKKLLEKYPVEPINYGDNTSFVP